MTPDTTIVIRDGTEYRRQAPVEMELYEAAGVQPGTRLCAGRPAGERTWLVCQLPEAEYAALFGPWRPGE